MALAIGSFAPSFQGANTERPQAMAVASQLNTPGVQSASESAGGVQVAVSKEAETELAVKPTPVTSSPIKVDIQFDQGTNSAPEAERRIPIGGPDEFAKFMAESGRDTRVAEMASSAETSAQDIALSEAVQAGEMEREAKAVEERVLESSPLPGTDAAKKAEARREPSGISPVAEADAAADEAFADAAAARDAADRVAQMQNSVGVVRGEDADILA